MLSNSFIIFALIACVILALPFAVFLGCFMTMVYEAIIEEDIE